MMGKLRISCKGYTLSTPDGDEFDCAYENSSCVDCDVCIVNGGDMSPVSGKKFRGNRAPYEESFRNRDLFRKGTE